MKRSRIGILLRGILGLTIPAAHHLYLPTLLPALTRPPASVIDEYGGGFAMAVKIYKLCDF